MAFIACPEPSGPVRKICLPIVSRIGRQRAMLCASPPTMMESVASAAFFTPPDTGASSIATPHSASCAPISRVPSGDDELMSISTLPRDSPATRQSPVPPEPNTTARTAFPSGSIVITASQREAMALSDPGASAPVASRARLSPFGEHVDLSDRRQIRFGNGDCIGLAMGQFHEDHELVAADPRKGVRLANPASHALGDLLKQPVPRLVAERVVDRFEAVDVEKKQRDLASAPCRRGEHLRQTFAEVRPVAELGQLILPRKPRDFLGFLRQKAVRARNPPEENRSIDGICNQTEDDRGTEERVLLPVGARSEVPHHAENRDVRREKQVVTPEAQPPPDRREEK